MGYGSGGGEGKATFHDLSFVHMVDKASPVLMTKCATGEHIKEGTLISRKAGKGQQEYLIIKMSDILVTSVQPSGSSEHPMESVSMQFAKVDLEYKPQKPDGTLDAPTKTGWNLKENKKV
jgi:type VI secretion system secreted protein Hcp